MNKKFIFSGVVLAVLIVLAMLVMRDSPPESPERVEAKTTSISETMSEEDQRVLHAALASPEVFQTLEKTEEEMPRPMIQEEERPKLLSEVERPARDRVQKEPVAVESLYFWKDYESLRKDEIRNPDSKENREGVVALMKARQRRVGQEQ